MSQTGSDKITVQCACGAKLKAPASAAGRKAKCPKCGNVLTVTAPVADDLDALYDLAAEEKAAAGGARASGEQADQPRCPSCAAPMPVGAVLCVSCGFDLRTKRSVAARQPGAPPARTPEAISKEKDTALAKGLAYSAGFALAGALAWWLVTLLTSNGFSPLALLVGVLAGIGMSAGYKGSSSAQAGIAAVLLAAGSILVATILIYSTTITSNYKKDPNYGQTKEEGVTFYSDADRQKFAVFVTDQVLEEQSLTRQTANEDQLDEAEFEAAKRVSRMKPSQLDELKRQQAQQTAKATGKTAAGPVFSPTYWKDMYGPVSLICIALGLASAFGLARLGKA